MRDSLQNTLETFLNSSFPHETYARLDADAQSLLQWKPLEGLSTTLSKTISPSLHSHYSIGLPQKNSVGLIYQSNQQLLYGRLFQDAKLEALMAHRYSPQWLLMLSGVSFLSRPGSFAHVQGIYAPWRHWTCVFDYHSTDQVIGLNHLYSFSSIPLSLGGECYYSAKEKSGGFSLGMSFKERFQKGAYQTWTALLNPMMGHFSSSFTTLIAQDCQVATQYAFNYYSLVSDLAIGLAYAPRDKDQSIKARWSLSKGLGLGFEARFGDVVTEWGLETDLHGPRPRSTIGLTIQM